MKIGILTHYDVNNLGAQLQMYATYYKLRELGHESVVLTYPKNYDFAYEQKLRTQISIRSIPYIIREFLVKKGVKQTWHNTVKYRKNKQFRKENFQFAHYATTPLDAVIIGADEVFSLEVGINMMMYGHGMLTSNCIAYAPSFGETNIGVLEDHNAKALVSSGLARFIALSARDKHTFEMEKQLTGRVPELVCDPVMLFDFSAVSVPVKPITGRYVAIYSYDRNMVDESEIQAITEFARKRGLKTVSIGNYHKWCDVNITCNCLEWLEYMKQAELVITDTFHGAVVSMVLHKEMAIMQRGINKNKLSALMRDTCSEGREVKTLTVEELEKVFSNPTDYENICAAIQKMRNHSEEYLVESLKACKG